MPNERDVTSLSLIAKTGLNIESQQLSGVNLSYFIADGSLSLNRGGFGSNHSSTKEKVGAMLNFIITRGNLLHN